MERAHEVLRRSVGDRAEEREKVRLQDAEHQRIYQQEASALGLKWDRVKERVNVVTALERLETVRAQEPLLRSLTVAMWRSLSGMQHGLIYALVLNSDRRAEKEVEGGVRALMSIGDERFQTAALASTLLLLHGQQLYLDRSVRATR